MFYSSSINTYIQSGITAKGQRLQNFSIFQPKSLASAETTGHVQIWALFKFKPHTNIYKKYRISNILMVMRLYPLHRRQHIARAAFK